VDNSAEHSSRATCYRCRKPQVLCLCARTRTVANRTPVVILQHRKERTHAVGTTRIARLGLERAEVHEVLGVTPAVRLEPGAALLYPGPGSKELVSLPIDERPRQLVVLDGTWHHARRLYRDNAWLRALPQVRLFPEAPSRYRIRKQPAEHCVSTLESVVAALRILEPETEGLDGLLDVFDSMVDEQQQFMLNPAHTPRYQRRGPRPSRAVPSALRQNPQRLLVVYGETAPLPRSSAEDATGAAGRHRAAHGRRRQLVRWSAVRPATGEVFDELLLGEGAGPSLGHLSHMGLDAVDLQRALPAEEVARRWRDFRQHDDLLVGWHPAMDRMLQWLVADSSRVLALKIAWTNLDHTPCGPLADLTGRLGLSLDLPALPGRAAMRLAEAAAVARHLIEVAPAMAHAEQRLDEPGL
jgi:DTW domain-containing protein YfiP